MVDIVQKGDPVLRKQAPAIPLEDIASPHIKKVIEKMKQALSEQEDGVAIAAPQIGESVRIFIVSGKVFAPHYPDLKPGEVIPPDLIFINPVITKLSKEKKKMAEGCLSVRWLYGNVYRSTRATVEAYDETGKKFSRGGAGLLAQIFQHETDHLNGVLFIDTAEDIEDVPPEGENGGNSIVFFGTSKYAVMVLEEMKKNSMLPKLIVTTPDKPAGKGLTLTPPPVKTWALEHKISCKQPENLKEARFIKQLQNINPLVSIVVAYGKIIPQEVIDIPTRGTLNVHASLLPELRGASPIETAILQDKKNTGVTIMQIDAELDHGPIIAQEEVIVEPWPPKASVLGETLVQTGAELLVKVLPQWIAGTIEAHAQDHRKATFTSKIEKPDGEINLDDNPYENFLKIQAFSDWPKTYFFAEKKGKKIRVIIKEAEYKNNTLTILRVVPEGKKEMNYADFLKS